MSEVFQKCSLKVLYRVATRTGPLKIGGENLLIEAKV